MSEPFIAEIRMFAGNFAPRGWAYCDGQILPIDQHQALFSLLGTTYGGDGRTTFGLPDLRGRVPLHPGQGPGLSDRPLGQQGGNETVVLDESQLPSHTHDVNTPSNSGRGDSPDPTGKYPAYSWLNNWSNTADGTTGHANVAPTGQGAAHNNQQPYQAVTFIISLEGLFPSRN